MAKRQSKKTPTPEPPPRRPETDQEMRECCQICPRCERPKDDEPDPVYCGRCAQAVKAVRADPMLHAQALGQLYRDSGERWDDEQKFLMGMALFHPEIGRRQALMMRRGRP